MFACESQSGTSVWCHTMCCWWSLCRLLSCEISYPCSLQARRSAHNEPLCSARSALPPRWLCSGTDQQLDRLERLSCRHIFLHSESPADHSYRLRKQIIVRINRWNNSSGSNSCRQTFLPDEVSSDSEPLRESHVLSSLFLLSLLFCHKLLQSKHLSWTWTTDTLDQRQEMFIGQKGDMPDRKAEVLRCQ